MNEQPQPPQSPPTPLLEPHIYLSAEQRIVIQSRPDLARLTETLGDVSADANANNINNALPMWVPQREIARRLGFDDRGVIRGLEWTNGKPYLWATEFENVHSLWRYDGEPRITIDGRVCENSESYYHSMKPFPYDDDVWCARREAVMERAVRAKLAAASPELGALLRSTHPHPLVSVKGDAVWGVCPRRGGENLLAVIWMRIRDELVACNDADVANC